MPFVKKLRGINALAAPVLALLLSACAAQQKEQAMDKNSHSGECAPIGVMAKRLISDYGLAYLADAIDNTATVRMWYVRRKQDERYGEWAEIIVGNNLQACIVRRGTDWHFAMGS